MSPQDPSASSSTPYGQPAPVYGAPFGHPGGQPVPYGRPVGRVRGTGAAMLLFVVTFGIYGLYWCFVTHEEMKKHTGRGLGGGLALLIAFFVGFVSPFLVSHEVGGLYTRRGQQPPVTVLTGLWVLPGALLLVLVLPIVWFVKTNGAPNAYWRSVGAPG